MRQQEVAAVEQRPHQILRRLLAALGRCDSSVYSYGSRQKMPSCGGQASQTDGACAQYRKRLIPAEELERHLQLGLARMPGHRPQVQLRPQLPVVQLLPGEQG